MTSRIVASVLVMGLIISSRGSAQVPVDPSPWAPRYVDAVNGLPLDRAIARALAQEPGLQAARTGVDAAKAMRLQARLRPNPEVSFERRQEPGGTDNQTMAGVEWSLDLFRRTGRVAIADREIAATELSVADRIRVLAADVRSRYGDVLGAVRDLSLLDELVTTTRRQHELLRSRVAEGASPPLERDLVEVELRRLESDRLLQSGRTEAALVELKRILGMPANVPLTVRDTLDDLVHRESVAAPAPADTALALDQRPDVREAAARVEVADARIDSAQRQGRFDVSVFANYMRMDAGYPQRGFAPDGNLERVRGQFNFVSAGATITVPVLNRNQGDVAAARAARAGAAATFEAARLTAGAELAGARVQDERAREAVRVYSTGARTLARQNLTIVAQSYELGRLTVFDVLRQQRHYLDLERGYTDALRAAYDAKTALNRALGDMQ